MITLKETLQSVSYYDETGTTVTLFLDELHGELRDAVLRYGIKQILADAAAAKAGTSTADRMARMQRRADALCDGTWGLRPAKTMPDAEVYDAAVACGRIVDSDAARAKWLALGKKDRNAVRSLPDVAACLPSNTKAESVLLQFMGHSETTADRLAATYQEIRTLEASEIAHYGLVQALTPK